MNKPDTTAINNNRGSKREQQRATYHTLQQSLVAHQRHEERTFRLNDEVKPNGISVGLSGWADPRASSIWPADGSRT